MKKHWSQNIQRAPAARRTTADGIVFDSIAEMKDWELLCIKRDAGLIRRLRRQVYFPLIVPVVDRPVRTPTGDIAIYTCDFCYEEREDEDSDWAEVIHESKGYADATSTLRIAVFEALSGKKVRRSGEASKKKKPKTGRKSGIRASDDWVKDILNSI